jgi:hypothetical protein
VKNNFTKTGLKATEKKLYTKFFLVVPVKYFESKYEKNKSFFIPRLPLPIL